MLVVWVIQEKRCSFWCGVPGGGCGGMPVCQSGQLFNCGLFLWRTAAGSLHIPILRQE